MTKNESLLLIFTLFLGNILFARDFYVTLKDQKIELQNNSYHISKVIDEREVKGYIGVVQKYLWNATKVAKFKQGTEAEVASFLDNNTISTKDTIQVVIRKLNIWEETLFSKEYGYCQLSIDFLLEKNGQLLFVCNKSEISRIKSGFDVTKKHEENIAEAFKSCLDQLASIDLSQTSGFYLLSSQDDIHQIPDSVRYNIPLFNKQKVSEGTYFSYASLKNNNSTRTTSKELDQLPSTNEPTIQPLILRIEKEKREVWCIVYNGTIYINHQGEFFPLVIDGYQMYFIGNGLIDQEKINRKASNSASACGLIGGLTSAIVSTKTQKVVAQRQKRKCILDIDTGYILKTLPCKE